MLCNWMVSLAVVAAFMSTSFSGKILAIWGPTLLFFSQGFEHAVVNMFLIPVGMILGANVSRLDLVAVESDSRDVGKSGRGNGVYRDWRFTRPIAAPRACLGAIRPRRQSKLNRRIPGPTNPGYSPSY